MAEKHAKGGILGSLWQMGQDSAKRYYNSPAFWTPGDIWSDILGSMTGAIGPGVPLTTPNPMGLAPGAAGETFGPGGLWGFARAQYGTSMPPPPKGFDTWEAYIKSRQSRP